MCHADSIIVMEGGTIVEMGPHDQLLKKEGVYYSLVHAQVSPAPLSMSSGPPSEGGFYPNSCQKQNSKVTCRPPPQQ